MANSELDAFIDIAAAQVKKVLRNAQESFSPPPKGEKEETYELVRLGDKLTAEVPKGFRGKFKVRLGDSVKYVITVDDDGPHVKTHYPNLNGD